MTDRPVKFGVTSRMYPPMDAVLDNITEAEAQGWDFLNFPDQLASTHPEGMLPTSPTPPGDESAIVSAYSNRWFGSFECLAAASVLTTRPEVHTAVLDAVRRNPAVIAQELVTISHMSKNRAGWAFASGENKQFEPYGEKRPKPIGRLEESLRIMHALWESQGEPVTRDSEFWPLKNALFPLPLYEGKKPRTWAVGGGERIEDLAGSLCDGWTTYLPGGVNDDPAYLANVIGNVKRIAKDHSRDPHQLDFNSITLVCLAENDDEAWRLARNPIIAWNCLAWLTTDSAESWKKLGFENPLGEKWHWGTHSSAITQLSPADAVKLADAVPEVITERAIIWGGPERVAARLKKFMDAGLTHVSFINYAPICDPVNQAAQSVPLLSDVIARLGGKPLKLDV